MNKPKIDIADNEKRTDYIVWDEYFMAMALLEVKRRNNAASDASIILNERKIIISCSSNLNGIDNTHVHHAEYKALENIQSGSTIYSTSLPCEECAKLIAQKGIVEVVYAREHCNSKSKEIFEANNIICRQFKTTKKQIVIDFNSN